MKKLIVLFIAIFIISSCSDNKTEVINTVEKNSIIENTVNEVVEEPIEEIMEEGTVEEDTKITMTLEEVAKHSISSDCYTVIDWSVYDLTSFFGKHPGWDDNILKTCWIDATELFNNQHWKSEKAKIKKEEFFIWGLK